MNWFIAKLVYRITCENRTGTAQFDEQLRLVRAPGIREAFTKSKEIGLKDEETFFNQEKQLVKWEFIDVCEIHPVRELMDGTEIYSRVEEKENAESYIHIIHSKARAISSGNLPHFLNLA